MPPTGARSNRSDDRPTYADVPPDALVQVGFVYRPHGLEGELKINPEHTDDPTRFEELEVVYVGGHSHRVTRHTVQSVRYQQTKRGTTVILGIADVDSRSDAERIAKMKVFATEEALDLGEDEFFIHELVGLEVVTEAGDEVGTVANYMEMPAQDVFVVRRPDGEEAMVPAVENFIRSVDLEEERVTVRPIEGLFK